MILAANFTFAVSSSKWYFELRSNKTAIALTSYSIMQLSLSQARHLKIAYLFFKEMLSSSCSKRKDQWRDDSSFNN
jgi:hypothetical protein